MLPSPAELVYFLEVVHTLNISRAAERLGISQPSLSLAIKRLEDSVGTPLLIRSKGGVNLSRAGHNFAAKAKELLEGWERLRDGTLKQDTEVIGRYVIGCHPSVALYALSNLITPLLIEFSQCEIKLNHGLSRKVTDLVIGFQADFGIVVNPTQHPDLVIKVLAKDEVGLWVGQKTPLSRLKGDSNVLIYDPDLLQCQWLLKQLKRKGWQFGRTLESSNLEVITALVAQGSGVGILPGRVATKDPHLGLRSIAGSPKFQDKVCLIYRADAQKSKAAKTLISRIAKCL